MEHSSGHLADRTVDILGADIDLAVSPTVALPDFIYAAPAVCAVSAVWRYSGGRALEFACVEVIIEKVKA